jgi:hypothetical protein
MAAAGTMVKLFKQKRGLMDPLVSNYYRLWQAPSTTPDVPHMDLKDTVGWLFEDASSREGLVYIARQAQNTSPNVSISLSRPGWPWTAPAPTVVRLHGAEGSKPSFTLLAGVATFAVSSDGERLDVQISTQGQQVLLGYSF